MSVFVVASALSAILAFFSSAIIVPAAVHAWGAPLTMLLLWTGWTVGGMGTYAVGRWLGRPVVKAMISEATLDQFEHRITTRAPFGLVLLFQFALPSEVPGSVLGLVRYSFAKYMAALTITELPYAVGTVYLGESFLEQRTLPDRRNRRRRRDRQRLGAPPAAKAPVQLIRSALEGLSGGDPLVDRRVAVERASGRAPTAALRRGSARQDAACAEMNAAGLRVSSSANRSALRSHRLEMARDSGSMASETAPAASTRSGMPARSDGPPRPSRPPTP